jgi:hypothetical protein
LIGVDVYDFSGMTLAKGEIAGQARNDATGGTRNDAAGDTCNDVAGDTCNDVAGDIRNDAGGAFAGVVKDVIDNPAHDILLITDTNGKEYMLPFVDAFVLDVDMEQRVVNVNIPIGLRI